eukprot:GEMP01022384.1.p1 GENE.GEMP01022384.1~~GEMP01022384.1.p1  ORF type:complete len:611 (+),score=124.09 GEMP01022384.1:405-2237(+)
MDDSGFQAPYLFRDDPHCLTAYTFIFWTLAMENSSIALVMSFLLGVIFLRLVSLLASEDEDMYEAVAEYELPKSDYRLGDNVTGEETERRATVPGTAPREKAPHVDFRDVWVANFDVEFGLMHQMIHSGELGSVIVGVDTEYPGVPLNVNDIDDFGLAVMKYGRVREIVDAMKLIQLGLAVRKENPVGKAETTVWQFHFQFDLDGALPSDPSVKLLVDAGLDFSRHRMQGIPMARFAEKLASSELRIMMKEKEVRWVSFHGLCDFGFLVKFTYKVLPLSYVAFLQLMVRDFPRVVDLKYMLPTTSLAALGESLHVVRYGFPHTAGSDALFTLNCFLALDKHQQHYAFCYPMVGHFFALADDESATTPADADHDRISEFIRDAQEAAQERRERELQYPSLRASPDLISDDRTPDSTTQSNHSAWNSTQQQGTPRVPFDATSTRRYSGEFAPQFPADSDAAPATAYTTDENYTGEQQLVNAEDCWWDPQWAHAQDWGTAMNGAKAADTKPNWRSVDDGEYIWGSTMNGAPAAGSRPPNWSLATRRHDWGTARNDLTASSVARGPVPYQRNYAYTQTKVDAGTSNANVNRNRGVDWYMARSNSDRPWKEYEHQ